MVFFNCLAQKCTLPGQFSSKNKPFKINFWIWKPMKSFTVTNVPSHSLSDCVSEVTVTGSVLKPVNSPGYCSGRQAGARLWSRKAGSLSQQVEAGSPGGRGVGVVVGCRE